MDDTQPGAPKELSPSNIVIGVLKELVSQKEVVESKPIGCKSLTMLPSWFLGKTLRRVNLKMSRLNNQPVNYTY